MKGRARDSGDLGLLRNSGHSTAAGQVSASRARRGQRKLESGARFARFRRGTRIALSEYMVHSTSGHFARSSFSSALGARAAVFAPVLIAALSLCSLAHAQEPAANIAPDGASPGPGVQPLPVASPSPTEPAAQPSATTPSTAREAAPSPTPVRLTPASDEPRLHFPTRVHQGFYLRFSSGPSFLTLRGHGPSGASASLTDSGSTGTIAIGGAIVPGLVLAGTVQGTGLQTEFKGGPFADATVTANGKTRSASHNADAAFGMIGLLVDWYPQPTGSWHAGFSTGLGAIGVTNSADDSNLGGVNFAGSVFGGYDWALGHDWALGLQLTASGATTTKMQQDLDSHDRHDSGYRLTPLAIGLQASLLYF